MIGRGNLDSLSELLDLFAGSLVVGLCVRLFLDSHLDSRLELERPHWKHFRLCMCGFLGK